MSISVLIVDDDESVRQFLSDALTAQGYVVAQAADGKTGLSMIPGWKPDIVLLDIQMPGMSGVDVLAGIREIEGKSGVIMISSVNELEAVRQSMKNGAYDYLLKPLDFEVVVRTIKRAAEHRAATEELERYRRNLEVMVFERTRELEQALSRIEGTYNQTILALGSALETRDVETRAHSRRVADYTVALCRKLGIEDKDRLATVNRGAFLHDIGKIGVPDSILRKPGPLTSEEWVVMKRHPLVGVTLLEGIEFLRDAIPIVRNHHERWDGQGYPDGLSETDIPTEARAFAVADALDAITSDRPYRQGRSVLDARKIIAGASGSQFDPDAVGALKDISDNEIKRIQENSTRPTRQAWSAAGGPNAN